jgi:Xaa-Pro aminopeptidase
MLIHVIEENEFGKFLGFELISFCPIDTSALDLNLLTDDEISFLNEYHRKVYEELSPHLTEEEQDWLKLSCKALPCEPHA